MRNFQFHAAILPMSFNNKLYKAAVPEVQYRFRANLFIWPNRTLFFGPLQKLEFHAMGAVTINIGLYQPFYMKTAAGEYKAFRCAVIPASSGMNYRQTAM